MEPNPNNNGRDQSAEAIESDLLKWDMLFTARLGPSADAYQPDGAFWMNGCPLRREHSIITKNIRPHLNEEATINCMSR